MELCLTGHRNDALHAVQTVKRFADRYDLNSLLLAKRLRTAANIRLAAHRARKASIRSVTRVEAA